MRRYVVALVSVLGLLTGSFVVQAPAVAAETTATITGTVTGADGIVVTGQIDLYTPDGTWVRSWNSFNGAYTFPGIVPGSYKLYYGCSCNNRNIIGAFQGGGHLVEEATPIDIVAGTTTINPVLPFGGTISGTLLGDGSPLAIGSVSVQLDTEFYSNYPFRTAVMTAGGQWTVSKLIPGDYRVLFSGAGKWMPEYWDGETRESADLVTVGLSEAVAGIVVDVDQGNFISGTVTIDQGGAAIPVKNVRLLAYDSSGQVYFTYSDAAGAYSLNALPPGAYELCIFSDGHGITPSGPITGLIADDTCTRGATPTVTMTVGGIISGVDYVVAQGAQVTGTVMYRSMTELNYLYDSGVRAWKFDEASARYRPYKSGLVSLNDPQFDFPLSAGSYVLQFYATANGNLGNKYWRDASTFLGSEELIVEAGVDLNLGEVVLDPREITVDRLTGLNRFGTAIEATKFAYPDSTAGVPVVYITNAFKYPDALAAGPAAVREGGALLTVSPTSVPAEVMAELNRLHPSRIVLVGGQTMVSDAVKNAIDAGVPSVTSFVRLEGANRYETSRRIAQRVWGSSGSEVAFIATGNNYPDALAVGPAAIANDAPVILVNGAASSVDAATLAQLRALGVTKVFIIGGTPSVSAGILNSIQAAMPEPVERITGANRYETAVRIAQRFFEFSDYGFLTNGGGFADALGGGALAGAMGAPLYLNTQQCLLEEVYFDIVDVRANEVYLLGGTNMLSDSILYGEICG